MGRRSILEKLITQIIQEKAPLGRIDYVAPADAATLQPVTATTELVVIAVAVFFGTTRLIDNIELK